MKETPVQVLARETKNGWQPIRTAPKDGRRLLLAASNSSFPILIGDWYASRRIPAGVRGRPNGCWCFEGVFATEPGDPVPTHWMPLPEAPA